MSASTAIVRRAAGCVLEGRELSPLAPGWARVALEMAGICRTDLYAADGSLPVAEGRVLGHEAAGWVVEGSARGRRVVVWPYVPCTECVACRGGGLCEVPTQLGVERDGLFRDRVDVPEGWLFEVPLRLPAQAAAFVEPVAAALAVLDEGAIPLAEPGRVVGKSRVATLVREVLRGAGACLSGAPRWVVETGGHSLAEAIDTVAPGGVVVLKSRPAEPVPLDLKRVVEKRLRLRAVRHAAPRRAIAWLLEHDVSHLWAEPHAFGDWPEAFAAARHDPHKKHFLAFTPCAGSSPP